MKTIQIINVKYLKKYQLEIEFSDKKFQQVDFEPFLEKSDHPEIKKYLDKNMFQSFQIVDGELMWNDYDLLFPISDLYNNTLVPRTQMIA